MGAVKDQLTLTPSDKKTKKKGMFNKLTDRKKQKEEKAPEKFIDMILEAEKSLLKMIETKETELETSSGQTQKADEVKISALKLMLTNIENISEIADLYHKV